MPSPARPGPPGANPIRFDIAASDDAAVRLSEKASFMLPR